jgi:hypothetical protein
MAEPETLYLRVAGFVRPNGRYVAKPGWVTRHVVFQPGDESPYEAQLLDATGKPLAKARMSLAQDGCGPWTPTDRAELAAYLPLTDDATEVLVVDTQLDAELDRAVIHRAPPLLELDEVTLAGTLLRARWTAQHPRPVTFNVAFFVGRDRAFALAVDERATTVETDIGHLPGGPECHVVVVATDGVRSATVISEPLAFAGAPARAVIIAPAPDSHLAEGEPFSLIGLVVDAGGRPVEEGDLRWAIDGDVVAEGTRLGGVEGLPAGEHVVQLELATDAPLLAASTSITVGSADEATLEWRRAAKLAERIALERGLRA